MTQSPAIKVFSDAARASALAVRRGGQALGAAEKPTGPGVQMGGMTVSPAIAARVKQILAEQASKGKKKAGSKGKGKAGAAQHAKAAADRAKAKAERVAKAAAAKQERTQKQAERATAQKQKQAERVATQAKKQAEHQAKLKQAAGKAKEKAKAAKQKQGAAHAAQQEKAKAAQAKQSAAQQHKTRVLAEKIKMGQKLSAADTVDAQDAGLIKAGKAIDMSELAIKAGARHSKMDMSHIQGIHDHAVACGANCAAGDDPENNPEEGDTDETDIAAGKAIKGIMDNPQWYASHECGDIMQASSALQTIAMLIQSELSEEDEDDADIAMLCDAARTLLKFIGGELDELEGAAGDAADNASMGPMNKAVSDNWLHIQGGAIKAMADSDDIGGYAVLFGDAANHDIEKDYYTKSTNFWIDDFGWPRPITYHHGMDAATRDDPVIGHWTKATIDDTGVWLDGQLNRAHAYYKAIKQLAARGYLKLSSDSAPQWVQREKQPNGANFVKRWPMITASCTVTPMEPRMMPVEVKAYLAELGYETIDDSPEAINPDAARRDGVKAAESERARRLLLELELLQLEMETA